MSTIQNTTRKHECFVATPMGHKVITQVPGIGRVYGQALRNAGFVNAEQLFGQFLVQGRDQNMFMNWFHEQTGANIRCQQMAYNGMMGFYNNFFT